MRGVCHRLAVLVRPRQKEYVLAALAMVARQHVGGDRRVRMTQVGRRVDVVDRGGYVEGGHARLRLLCVYRERRAAARGGPPREEGGRELKWPSPPRDTKRTSRRRLTNP